MTDVVMPQMGESIVEGTLTKWLKKRGERVERDEPLFEISTDKVDTEIPSPAAGTLSEVLVEEGKTVGINTVVARIDDAGNGAPVEPARVAEPAPAPEPPKAAEAPKEAAAPPQLHHSPSHQHRRRLNPRPRRGALQARKTKQQRLPVLYRRWCAGWRASTGSILAV